jgi:hypothetical protein
MMKNLKKVVAYVLPVGAMLPSLAFAQANAWSILGVFPTPAGP